MLPNPRRLIKHERTCIHVPMRTRAAAPERTAPFSVYYVVLSTPKPKSEESQRHVRARVASARNPEHLPEGSITKRLRVGYQA